MNRQPKIHVLVVKIAELCNLNCSYCYMYNHVDQSYLSRPKFMSDEIYTRMLHSARAYCEEHAPHGIWLTFHGGEPTLIGTSRFDTMANMARDILGDCLTQLSLQTNASFIDEKWCALLREHKFNVGVSMDGPLAVHDSMRKDHLGRGSYNSTRRGLTMLQDAGLTPGVLCVVNPMQNGLEVYRHFCDIGVRSMDFLLPDVTHDSRAHFYPGLRGTPVADYLIPIFDAWYDNDDPEIRIRLLWSVMRQMMGGSAETDAFGNDLMSYLVVETDGAIEALDALKVCESGLNSSGLNVLHDGFERLPFSSPIVRQFIYEGMPLSTKCQTCHEREICGGGYLPHRFSAEQRFNNPSVWCEDILKLFAHMRLRITPAVQQMAIERMSGIMPLSA